MEGSDLARIIGQYGQARILARDVEWGGYQFERMEIQVKNVHLRPGTRPVLVAAPVLCEGFMPAEAASRWLATVSPQLELVLRDGVPQVGVIGAPWARLEVETGAEGRSVHVRPRALRLGDLRLSLWSPTFSVSSARAARRGHSSPRWNPWRAGSSCGACSANGSARCPAKASSGCWPACAPETTASTSDGPSGLSPRGGAGAT